ncbi:MAG: YheC/YheD family protein [Anaerobacillus sp.]|uniref:YheC/YheD family protein n=1 Tax=Anaerobacillus sp. TaxID=1872506 RepID=UPI00391D1CFE
MKRCRRKWDQYTTLIDEEFLKAYLPETKPLDESSFWELLDRNKQIIVKPNRGRWGNGVLKIKKIEGNKYEFCSEMNKRCIHGRFDTYKNVKRYLISDENIVQHAISLAEIGGAPFDLRVMVQRKKNSPTWAITGMVAKVASKRYFITNTAGKVMNVDKALEDSNIKKMNYNELIKLIEEISIVTAEKLSSVYPKHRIYGIDIGIDKKGKPWLFEANFNPNLAYFRMLADKKTLNKIRNFKRKKASK